MAAQEAETRGFIPARERLRRWRRTVLKALLWMIVVPAGVLLCEAALFRAVAGWIGRENIRMLEERDEAIRLVRVDEAEGRIDPREVYGRIVDIEREYRDREEAGSPLEMLALPALVVAFVAVLLILLGCFVVASTAATFAYGVLTRERLHRLLLDRGYEWTTRDDAEWLLLKLPRHAWSLPRAEDACVLPGVSSDVDGLVEYVRVRSWIRLEQGSERRSSTS